MESFADYVIEDQPHLFAIYGLYRRSDLGAICGWGMEWDTEYGGAVFYDPVLRQTTLTDSARQLHTRYSAYADARLVWLR